MNYNVVPEHLCVGEFTQELVEGVKNGAPGLSGFLSHCLRKMSCTVIDVETIDTLQDQADHPLKTQNSLVLLHSPGLRQCM